jgi:glycosyltransferase involved in cell wall biosynthesis
MRKLSEILLTLVVCTLGRTDQLRRLLASLGAQTDTRFRTIIVDQNPPGFLDAVLRDAASPPLVLRAKPGLSRARNLGIANAATPLIGFPDDDCWYAPTTVAEVIGRFERAPAMQVLTGRTVDAEGRESVSGHLPESCRIERSSVFLAGNSNTIFARRAAILAADGFDESLGVGAGTMFGSGEETDFLLRCLGQGFEVRYERDFLVHHDQVAVSDADLARIRRYSAGFGRVARLHRLGAAFVGGRVARAAARSGLFLITGNIGEARSRWTWIRGCLAGFTASSR